MSRKFQSWLAPLLARFVALKRAGGYLYNTQERALVNFDRYLDEHVPKAPFHEKSIIAYLASLEQLSPKARDTVINVVWQALSFAQRHDAKIAPLPPRPPRAPRNFRLRPPRIVSHKEICSIIAVARRLSHPHACPLKLQARDIAGV